MPATKLYYCYGLKACPFEPESVVSCERMLTGPAATARTLHEPQKASPNKTTIAQSAFVHIARRWGVTIGVPGAKPITVAVWQRHVGGGTALDTCPQPQPALPVRSAQLAGVEHSSLFGTLKEALYALPSYSYGCKRPTAPQTPRSRPTA